jgi:hypothetical protein
MATRPVRAWTISPASRCLGFRLTLWLLDGHVLARGPDNEPLVGCDRPVAWIDDRVISEAVRTVDEQNACWGPLRRPATS